MSKNSAEVAMSFKDLCVSSINPSKNLITGVSGFIKRGGMTAILGPTAAGKTLTLNALSGRAHDLRVTGDLHVDGRRANFHDVSKAISFAPEEDILTGCLTPRETFYNSAAMRGNHPPDQVHEDVEKMLEVMGLSNVADNRIGTDFVRGLSGGQKKRVEIGVELINRPQILFLDEPTSGLDAYIAYDILRSIRDITESSRGNMSVMVSIHQPNSRILELFDNILILCDGGMNFFGSVAESIEYLSSLGFPPLNDYTPTDHFLQITDRKFSGHIAVDFAAAFRESYFFKKLNSVLDSSRVSKRGDRDAAGKEHNVEESKMDHTLTNDSSFKNPLTFIREQPVRALFLRQLYILLMRDLMVARRDYGLYYTQSMMTNVFSFLIGAILYSINFTISADLLNLYGGASLIIFVMCNVHIFKGYHLSRWSALFKHEKANNTYSVEAAFLADLLFTSAAVFITIVPATAITYFMMGLPKEAYPFCLFTFWLTTLAAESMVNIVTRVFPDATTALIISQGMMVIQSGFGAGIFISWNRTPSYWIWLQEASITTQATRAMLQRVNDYLTYKCITSAPSFACLVLGQVVPCDARASNGYHCYIKGRTVMKMIQGTNPADNAWTATGYLVLIFFVFRAIVLLLMYYPIEKIVANFKKLWTCQNFKKLWTCESGGNAIEAQNVCAPNSRDDAVLSYNTYREPNFGTTSFAENPFLPGSMIHYENYEMTDLFAEEFNPLMRSIPIDIAKPPHCLVWRNLTLTLNKGGAALIDGVSGTARAGRVLALMGPSGAGKTTLLNSLGNRAPYGKISGEISYGKRELTMADLYYVPQSEVFNDSLTVREQIEITGLLKCSDRNDMYERLDVVILSLGLRDQAYTRCRDLTGGELKKVSVGMGMISKPAVLFLDEPTSGLDSTSAYSVVQHLVDLAEKLNISVIMTIHQPSEIMFDMLQDLYLLEGGRLVYSGPVSCSEKYFSYLGYSCPYKSALADYYLDIVSCPPTFKHQSEWKSLYLESNFCSNVSRVQEALILVTPAAGPATLPPHNLVRFLNIVLFFFKYYSRDIRMYHARTLTLIGTALFSGSMFANLKTESGHLILYAGAVYFNTWIVLFSAVGATGLFARDRQEVAEQIKNNVLSPGMYCFSQLIVSIPFNFVGALAFQSIFHWLSNINPEREAFIYAVLLTCGHILLMEAYMLSVIETFKDAMLSVTISSLILGYLLIFSGFFLKVVDMPAWIRWISYVTPTKYSFDGYTYQIFHGQSFLITGSSPKVIVDGDYILQFYFKQANVKPWVMFGILMSWVVLIRLLHFCILSFQLRHFLPQSGCYLRMKALCSMIRQRANVVKVR